MRSIRTSSVPAFVTVAFALTALAASPADAAFDHLKCFKIKDSLAKATYTADIDPSDPVYDAVPPGCEIKTPAKLLCVDAEKTNVSPAPPGAADGVTTQPYLCYKAKCTKVQPTDSLTDQFGLHSIEVKSASLVCAPVPAVPVCPDNDMDTYTTCAGDCDDSNQTVNPGAVEVCNLADDNCSGMVDESDPGAGQVCMTGQPGVCASGTTACSGGMLACVPSQSPSPETCDNLDNDCDGFADEGNPGGGGMCTTGQPGVCGNGTTQCTGGMIQCTPDASPSSEVCDMLDNDCDGTVDEGVCLADGSLCTMNSECFNSNCVDGVCCNSACNATCEACTAAKKGSGVDGSCGFIAANTDPDNECAGTMTCDGSGLCQP